MAVQSGFGERVRKARVYAGYSQLEISKALGCNARTIWHWEQPNAAQRPNPALFHEFATLTNSDIAWLYDGEERDVSDAHSGDQSHRDEGHGEGAAVPDHDD